MVDNLFKKWWSLLLQGVLLIILSIYIFKHPIEVLAGISFWIGIVILATGAIGVIAWLAVSKPERENFLNLLWSVLTLIIGILMLFNLRATMKILTVIFGLWCLSAGLLLFKYGWSLRTKGSMGLFSILSGIAAIALALMMIFNVGTGAFGISTILGLQVLLTGIILVVLSIAKKILAGVANETAVK